MVHEPHRCAGVALASEPAHSAPAGDAGTSSAKLAEYRQRYILAFAPEGVARGDGWHPLKVTLRRGRGTVHARDGYWSQASSAR